MHDTTTSDVPAVSIKQGNNASLVNTTQQATVSSMNVESPKTPNDTIENDMWQAAMNKPDGMHESLVMSKARYETTPDSSGSDSIVSTPQDLSQMDEHVKQVSMPFSDTEGHHLDIGMTQPSATAEAMETYVHLLNNVYRGQARSVSFTGEESMPCDCKYNPDLDDPMAACGDDNACINRMMFMECTESDCSCGRYCLNRRFQLQQYARVDVIHTEKKGYGLRALADLPTNAFVMEYIGEVISRDEFIRRTKKYENEGLKHHYSMTLNTDEIIDATKKGCLARFINHSCDPNCVTQKWVVGKSMRVGIFTRRPIKAGQEITFDYQFERYGDAQKCFCGEQSCKGVIGGVSQGDQESTVPWEERESVSRTKKRTAKLSTIRPLKHTDDVRSFVKMMLDSEGNVDLVNKLLETLQVTIMENESKDVLKMFVRCHGLKMLKLWLGDWKTNDSIIKKVLRVLKQLPLANRNGLEDCKFFEVMNRFVDHDDVDINELAQELMGQWRGLKSVYRIPKRTSPDSRPSSIEKDADGDVVMMDRKRNSHENPCKKQRFDSTRDFFDPDNDMFEYISPSSNASDIQTAIQYPPMTVTAIPIEPKAHFDDRENGIVFGKHHFSPNSPTNFNHLHAYSADRRPRVYSPPHRYTSYHDRIMDRHYPYRIPPPPRHVPTTRCQIPLPPNWRSARDEDGTIYYYNRITRVTQWHLPEEKTSTIEGVDQCQIDNLVEKAMEHKKQSSVDKKILNSSKKSITSKSLKSISREEESGSEPLSDKQLKMEISELVKKHLSRQRSLWNNDKELFKELARNLTRHIVECETRSSRKVYKINKNMRIKVEKLIEIHGTEFAKRCSIASDRNTTSSHTSTTISRENTPSWF